MKAGTLARLVHGCVVETITYSAEDKEAAEKECKRRNGLLPGTKWVVLDGFNK